MNELVPLLAALGLAGCSCSPPETITAAQWPEADALFHRDPRWLGADAAFSIPLGDDRILWLFGDTFVAKSPANVRAESKMVRNTVALQTGADPTTAAITFHWRGTVDLPTSYFPEEGERWFWPEHGARIGPSLVVFLSKIKATPGQGLGFEADGWTTAIVDDASGSPDAWTWRFVAPVASNGLVPGQAVNVIGDRVVTLAQREPGDHAGFLVRWTPEALLAGRLDEAEWWSNGAWVNGGEPSRVLANAGAESSLHFDPKRSRWFHVRSEGFGATTIVVDSAPALEGPWTSPKVVFTPPESGRADAFVYAAKGHPELTGADLVVTYASNTLGDFSKLINDTSLYFPRFVKLTLKAQ
jgi:hypothetical protein